MSHGAGRVSFRNSYGARLYVAYMRRNFGCLDDCPGEPWEVRGWIALDPGEVQSRANSTDNRWYYYYAEAVDGARWSGPFVENVTTRRFSKCSCIGVVVSHGSSGYFDVGMRELDTVAYSGVNFVR